MLFIHNSIWTKNKLQDYEKYVEGENRVLLTLERAGQFIVMPAALLFSDFNYKGWNFWAVVLLASFLTEMLRRNRTIDWQKKETARAAMRKMVKRLLK